MWSTGVILYALVCGYLPFEDPNTSKLYKKIMKGDYECPEFISPRKISYGNPTDDGLKACVAEVQDLIGRILNTDPAHRFDVNQVRTHPWYTQVTSSTDPSFNDTCGANRINEPLNEEVAKEVED